MAATEEDATNRIESTYEYTVTIKTGDEYAVSGTKSNVSLQLVGRRQESDWFRLREDFTPGKISEFLLQTRNVGKLLMIRLNLTHEPNSTDAWFVDNIKVKTGDKESIFPLYEFIYDTAEVVGGQAKLSQHLYEPILTAQRKREIKAKQTFWMWKRNQKNSTLYSSPRILEHGNYEDLPTGVKMVDTRFTSIMTNRRYTLENTAIAMKTHTTPWNSLEAYKNLFNHPQIDNELPEYMEEWDTDHEFGRQILNGANPTAVELCTTHKIEGSNISSAHLDGLIEEKTIEEAVKKGKLFMVNHFESLKDVPRNTDHLGKQLYAADPLCLLYAYNNGTFAPVAIQLKANDSSTIFTPKDNEYDWLLAKMHFRCTTGNHQEWISHYLLTHAGVEPIAISILQLLPRSHPIFKLLRPHLRSIIAINSMGRKLLFSSKARSNDTFSINGLEAARKGYTSFSFNDLNIPKLLKKKGTYNNKRLKNYLYRDDTKELWKIIEKYVVRVIRQFYSSNQDVKEDFELQNWIYETATEGYGWEDGNTRDVPTKFDTVEELISFCTVVIGTSSIQHTAVSFGRWYVYQYIPNSPLGLRQPINKHGEGSLEKILETLPLVYGSASQIGMAYLLSAPSPTEIYLGEFPMDLFQESRIGVIRDKLREELISYQDVITRRNKNFKYPYELLMPDKIPSGLSL